MEFHQKISMFDCRKLTTMVKRSVDQKLRLRNFDARNERIDIGAVVTSRRGLSGVDRGHGVCYRWKAQEQCPSEDKCSVVLLSRFFSAEHAAVGNEARAERIKFSRCVLMIGVFPFFSSIVQLCDQESKAYFWISLWHDEQPEHHRHA